MLQTKLSRRHLLVRTISLIVVTYGIVIIASSLMRQLRIHNTNRDIGDLIVGIPLVIGFTFIYLGSLLSRQKYTAWVLTVGLFVFILALNLFQLTTHHGLPSRHTTSAIGRDVVLPLLILTGLLVSRASFHVRSDIRSFGQALRFSAVIIIITLVYGVLGFTLMDKRDFHKEISFSEAIHQTIDQAGLTTNSLTPHTRRAKLFSDSLPVVTIATAAYVFISLFQPLRARLTDQSSQRQHVEELLERFPSDIDDFFKLWPHDKLYFMDSSNRAGIAYHVTRGVALVIGDPFGDPKRFAVLLSEFNDQCFVNDWMPAFIHVSSKYENLYKQFDFRLQKIGEEAVLDLDAFQAEVNNKYFRQIRNRFTKLGYSVELLQPPHNADVMKQLNQISNEWLQKPGRSERALLLGYFSDDYMQRGPVAVAVDESHKIKGFINLVPTFKPGVANYDLLRCGSDAPGNCNDFLLLGLIEALREAEYTTLNLGLCPLSGLEDADDDEKTIVDNALRFVYANGDRFYSFSGLRRFKSKYNPNWEDRYISYRGGIRGFTRTVTALNRGMKK